VPCSSQRFPLHPPPPPQRSNYDEQAKRNKAIFDLETKKSMQSLPGNFLVHLLNFALEPLLLFVVDV
jgi:hypothetical protein